MQNIYSHNWYKRNTETYVFGPAVPITSTFTNLLYTPQQCAKLLSNYGDLAKEIESIINQRFGVKVNVKVSDTSEDTYTDGRNIVIASQKDVTDNFTRLDLIFGLAFHELAHCLYTKFRVISEKNMFLNPFLKELHNILEDEEIENRLVKRNLGYGKYLAKVKHDIIATHGCSKESILKKKVNNLDEIMTIFFCLIRYPKYLSLIDKKLLDKYEDLFIKINNILINANCPAVMPFANCSMYESSYYDKLEITPTTVNATFEIYKYLQEYIAEDFEKQRKECEQSDDSFMNQGGMPIGSSERNPDDINKLIDNEFGIIMPHDDVYEGAETGDKVEVSTDRVRFGNSTRYIRFYNEIKRFVPAVQKAIIPNDVKMKDALEIRRFRRNGNLDTNRLAEAMQNVNTIYNQRFTIKKLDDKCEPKYAFVVMMDESGSMNTYDHRNEFSVKTAILFYEVLSKFPGIELFVYGHGDKINPYITKERKDKYVLGNFDCQCCQNEEYSYNWIINDVKRQTNLPIVVLNITDFYYHSTDRGLTQMFDNFKKSNISFNLLNLGTQHSPREIAMCKRVLDGQVVPLKNINNDDEIKEAFNQLAVMLNDNYKKFNRK